MDNQVFPALFTSISFPYWFNMSPLWIPKYHVHVGLFLGFLFHWFQGSCHTALTAITFWEVLPHCRAGLSLLLVFFKNILIILGPLHFNIDYRVILPKCYVNLKNPIHILFENAMYPQGYLGEYFWEYFHIHSINNTFLSINIVYYFISLF